MIQCKTNELQEYVLIRTHQPLVVLSCEFNGAELRWTTLGKKRFAITEVFTHLDYMLQCEPLIGIIIDRRKLLFVFCLSLLGRSLGNQKLIKVTRSAVFFSQFYYKSEHVNGEHDVMPNIMTL